MSPLRREQIPSRVRLRVKTGCGGSIGLEPSRQNRAGVSVRYVNRAV
jgi:hypothetical protein